MANPNQEIKYTKLFINNRWTDAKSGKTLPALNPATGKQLAKFADADKADVDFAVEFARKAAHRGSPWRQLNASSRGQLLYRLADFMKRDQHVLANLETLDTGKTFQEAFYDVQMAIDTLRYYAGFADKIHGRTIPSDGQELMSSSYREPIGVIGIIAASNHPIALWAQNIAPALAAGCTVVYKPSSKASLSCLQATQLTNETGFPEGVINVITGTGQNVGHAISTHNDIRHVTFTGRKENGKFVMQAAAQSNLKRVSLHLGGNNSFVVLNDANPDEAAQIAHYAAFANQGQNAGAGGRFYVQDDVYDNFVKRSVELARKRTVGNPFDKSTRQGPLSDELNFTKVMQFIEGAKQQGAKLEYGGTRNGSTGYFIEPTVFSNVKDDMHIAQEEVFGPVQVIMRFKTLDEVVDRCNNSKYGLAAGVITPNIQKAMQLSQRFDAGTVWINTWQEIVPQASFGGYKESGWGRSMGREAIEQYLVTKTVSALLDPTHFNQRFNQFQN